MRTIAVSFNASDWFNDNYKLFDYGFDNYSLYTIYNKGQLLKKINVDNVKKNDLILVADKHLLYPLKEEETNNVKINLDMGKQVILPIVEGENLGYVKTYLDGEIIKSDKLVAKYGIKQDSLIEKIKDFLGF